MSLPGCGRRWGAFRKSVGEFGEVSPEEIEDWPKVEVRRVSAANRFRAVEKVVAEVKPGLLVVGKRGEHAEPGGDRGGAPGTAAVRACGVRHDIAAAGG